MIYLLTILKRVTQFLVLLWVFWLGVGVSQQDKLIGTKIGLIAISSGILTLIVWAWIFIISEDSQSKQQQVVKSKTFDNFLAGVGIFLFLLLILAIALPDYL